MSRYLLRRVAQAILVLVGVTLIVFMMIRVTGDPARLILSRDASAEEVSEFRERLGYDQPLIQQFGDFVSDALAGDFGTSLKYRQPVVDLILERLPATIELALGGLALTIVVGVPLGMIAAARPGSVWDGVTQALALISQSIPIYWAGLVLILVFGVQLGLVPTFGRGGWTSYILPVVTISLQWMGRLARLTRSAMLEVSQQDYILAARARGARPLRVNFRHALRNAAIPLVTYSGLAFGYMLGGSVIVESVFAWPGLGYLAYEAIQVRDFPLVQAIAIFISIMFVTVNLLVDLSYAVLNPRVRYG
jgi:ABC-type dipeptide/oligopeptide/nickel transport system permease component